MASNPNSKISHNGDLLNLVGKNSAGKVHWTGEVLLREDRMWWPVTKFKSPSMIFVPSLGDLFHPDVPESFIYSVILVMVMTPEHQYLVLTKRPERMAKVMEDMQYPLGRESDARTFSSPLWPIPNLWAGTSVEDQSTADSRIPEILRVPAPIHWVSYEPALGPVDLSRFMDGTDRLDWIVWGGESGPRARRFEEQWALNVIHCAKQFGVKVFGKQMGTVWAREHGLKGAGGDPAQWGEQLRIREYPEVAIAKG